MSHRTAMLAALLFFPPACSIAADWPQFRNTPQHSAAAPAVSGTLLVPTWSAQLPAPTLTGVNAARSITASPAIVNGVVYIGSRNAHFYALDAATGTVIWDYSGGFPVESSPLVRDGVVYFVSSNHNNLSPLTALDASTGALVWTHPSGAAQDQASPAISNGNVVCGASYPANSIYAVPVGSIDPAPEAWRFHAGQPVFSSPAVDPGTQNIYCGANDGNVYGLKPDGTALWAQPFQTNGGIYHAAPAVANGKVYISGGDFDKALHALDAATGTPVWSAPMDPTPQLPSYYYTGISVSSPAVDGDFVSVVGGYGNSLGPSQLFAFRDSGASAQPLWTAPLPNSVDAGYVSSPALTPQSVIVGVSAAKDNNHPTYPLGRVYVAARASGNAQWYADGGLGTAASGIMTSPAVAGNLVVVADNAGFVTAYNLVMAGDVDGDNAVTALDAVKIAAFSSSNGTAPAAVTDRADLYPATTPRADGSRSFGDSLLTPNDADRVLKHALVLDGGVNWP